MAGRCLIADESSVIRRIMGMVLEDVGYETVEAGEANAALAACQELMPDLIFIEWHIPGRDAFELMRAIRKLDGGAHPRIVFLTTENDVVSIARALRAGATSYLMKPFDREILQAKVQDLGLID